MSKKKIYTKTGDDGKTSLLSGSRVSKHDVRLKAYGTIDELNSWIGLIRSFNIDQEIIDALVKIQKNLFIIGSELANDLGNKNETNKFDMVRIKQKSIQGIENQIDQINSNLPELKNFVIPGGHILVSYTHISRCVCRRAEQMISELSVKESISPLIIPYINRLSDYLFVLSRKFSIDFDSEEIKWVSKKKQ